jgi:hypothetical protein
MSYLDESQSQTDLIMNYQRALSAVEINHYEENEKRLCLQNVQRILKPVKIINPFANKLILPQSVFKPRRTNSHYLQFIEAVTFYYQYQREEKVDKKTGEIYIETTLEDIENANNLLKEVLLRKSDELTGNCRNYLEQVKNYLKQRNKNNSLPGSGFTNREIRQALRVNPSNQKRYNLQLQIGYYMKRVEGKKATGYHYEIVSPQEYEVLQTQINSVLDKTLETLKKKK